MIADQTRRDSNRISSLMGPDRSRAAAEVVELLAQGEDHVHVFGPPGFGKREVVAALASLLETRATIVDFTPEGPTPPSPLAALRAAVGQPSDEGLTEWVQTWKIVSEILTQQEGEKPVLVLLGAEHLFLSYSNERLPHDISDRLALVTVSLAPWSLICEQDSGAPNDIAAVQLKAFPPADDDGYDDPADTSQRWNADPDISGYLAEGEAWFARYLEEHASDAEESQALRKPFRGKYLKRKDELWAGHPLVNMMLLRRMLDAQRRRDSFREEVDKFRLELSEKSPNALYHRLLPFSPGAAGATALPAIESVGLAVEALLQKKELSQNERQWLLSAGLVEPMASGDGLRWTRVVSLLGNENADDGIAAIRAWAEQLVIVARQERRRAQALNLDSDSVFAGLLSDVQAVFCQTDAGIAENARVDVSRCRAIVANQIYLFRILRDFDNDEDAGSKQNVEPKSHDVMVFKTENEGVNYWRHQVRTLSTLGRLRHPSLISFSRGGDLVPVDEEGGSSPPMYIEIEHRVEPLPSHDLANLIRRLQVNSSTGKDAPSPAYEQIVLLAEALDLIHIHGIVHRRIDFDALAIDTTGRAPQLVLTGFEYSTSLREDPSQPRMHGYATLGRTTWNRACQAPETLGATPRDLDPSVDIYAFGALAIILATGLPDISTLRATDALIPVQRNPENAAEATREIQGLEQAAALLREDLLRPERWSGTAEDTRELQALFERCLHKDPSERPTAEELALHLGQWHSEYLATFDRHEDQLFASYPHTQMVTALKKTRLIPEDKNTDGPEGRAWLRNKIQDWVDAATWIHYRESGFPKGGRFDADLVRRASKYILAGPDVVFFASVYVDRLTNNPDPSCLWLAYIMRRDEINLPDPSSADPLARRTTENTTWIPRPKNVTVLQDVDVAETERQYDWERTLDDVRRQGRGSEEFRLGREATTVWRLHRDVVATEGALARFPVKFEPASGDSDFYRMKLDRDRFEYMNLWGAKSFLRRALMEGTDELSFFVDQIQQRIAGSNGTPHFLVSANKNSSSGDRLLGTARSVESDNSVEVEFEHLGDHQVPSEAELYWIDSFGTNTALRRQSDAIDRLERRTWLLDYLVSPRSCGTLKHRVSNNCGRMLRDVSLDDLRARVSTMLSSDPLHAVQGPPGTGKTTLIAALIAEVLALRDGSRMLVTSQSHSATDNVLLAVEEALDKLHQSETDEEEDSTIITRVFSETTRESVDSRVVRDFSITAQVRRAQDRMKKNADRTDPAGSEHLNEAVKLLRKVSKSGDLEVYFKIERSAPLVFATTGAAMTSLGHLRRGSIGFDFALIDEAAKAWAVDLVQPLSIADRAILVGDQKQLPPFGERDLIRTLEAAKSQKESARVPPDVHELLSMVAEKEGEEAPYDRMRGWLKPFHRLFDKCPPQAHPQFGNQKIPLTQSLNRQFRSVAAIGSLVSDTFYQDIVNIQNAGPEPNLDRRIGIQVEGCEDKITPAVVWIDTATKAGKKYFSRGGGSGGLINPGEANLVAQLIRKTRVDSFAASGVDPIERLRILSPYKGQVNYFKKAFKDHDVDLGLALLDLERHFQTVDSSQGSEADVVVISLCRRLDVDLDRQLKAPAGSSAYLQAVKKQVDLILGFLQQPERLNVLCSRARQQLIIVGDFEYFKAGGEALDDWKSTGVSSRRKHQFWTNLVKRFELFDPDLHADASAQEHSLHLPVEKVVGIK